MEKKRFGLSRSFSLTGVLLIVFLACSCSAPRVVVLKDPLSAAEHIDLGVIYEQKNMLDLARKEYLKAAEKEDTWWLPLFNLGNLSYLKRDLTAAERYYRRALALDSSNTDVMNNLANLLCDTGHESEAFDLIKKALCLKRKPEYLDTYMRLLESIEQEDTDDQRLEVPGSGT